MRRLLSAYWPALLWALVIAALAGASDLPDGPAVPHLDKVVHFGVYLVLGGLLGWGWTRAGQRPARTWLLVFALLLGASDEYRHSLNPKRTAELGDWVADALGAATGLLLTTRLLARRRDDGQRD
jgi:VanZ family protein